jgi:3-oxoacyl-[acyl-carrier protein] reductase
MGSSAASDSLIPAGRRVIVTGAEGGIGRATVALLEAAGCSVAGCDIGDFDVTDRDAVDAGVAVLVDRLGGCDAVVANAGVVDTIHRAERFPDADWHRDVETNLTGQFNVVRAAFEALRESGDGRVAIISSVSAETGIPGQVAYAAAKAGLVGMAPDARRGVGDARDPLQRRDAGADRHSQGLGVARRGQDGDG